MLLPTTCPLCRRPGPAPCPSCAAALRPPPSLPPPPGVERCTALLAYEDAGRDLVSRLKYRNARSPLRWLAAALAGRVGPAPGVVVTWVPTSGERRRRRGFDQAQLLAAAVAAELRRPCQALLTREPGPPQTGRSLDQRRAGPSFRARPRGCPPPERVLLVDDVVTTGSSLARAARVLRCAGVAHVDAAVVARTPLRHRGD